MKVEEVRAYFGGKWCHVSRGVGVTESTVAYWRRRGHISYRTQLLIEKITDGQLKASLEDGKSLNKEV